MTRRTFNKPTTKIKVDPALDIRTANFNNLPGTVLQADATRGDQFTQYEGTDSTFSPPSNPQMESRSGDRGWDVGTNTAAGQLGDGTNTIDEARELADREQAKIDDNTMNDLNKTGKDLANAGSLSGGSWSNAEGTSFDHNPFGGSNVSGDAPTQEFLISTRGKTGVFSQNPKKITLTDAQAIQVYEDYKTSGQGKIRVAPKDGSNLNYAEVATWLNPSGGFDKFGPKKMEQPMLDKSGDVVRDVFGKAMGSGVYNVEWPQTSYEAELAQKTSDKKSSKDSSHPPPARFGKNEPWFTILPHEVDYNRIGQIPVTNAFGNTKWISNDDFKDTSNIMSTSGFGSIAEFTKTFYKTDAKTGLKYKTSGQLEHEKSMKKSLGDKYDSKKGHSFLSWGNKKPMHFAEGDFNKRQAIMGVGDYGKDGAKGWTGLTFQQYNRDFNTMKRNMMSEIRGLQGPGSKDKALGIIQKYKTKAAKTGMAGDFADIASRWEKTFKKSNSPPGYKTSSSSGYQQVGFNSNITWKDAQNNAGLL